MEEIVCHERRHARLPGTLIPYIAQAHAMEEHTLKMLEQQAPRFYDLPDVHARLSQFLERTEHHLARIEQLLTLYDQPIPWEARAVPFSFTAGTPAGNIEASLPNTLVRGLFKVYVFTHYEIAFYTYLATAALVAENDLTAITADEIIRDKEEMQRWMLENFPEVTVRSLHRQAVPVPETAWQFALRTEPDTASSILPVAVPPAPQPTAGDDA